jgi:type II secretory pathway predicted ATPase ExeA
MYLKYYNFKLKPFEIGPDPKFLWLGGKHEEAFAKLRYGILENKGFVVTIGEPGTGKSTLLNALADTIGDKVWIAKIPDPALSEMDFFNFVAKEFEIDKTFEKKAAFLIHLKKFVNDCAAQNTQVVLVIDEAQRLSPDLLEQIRVLSNIETPNKKVITCIFAGQSEFLALLQKNRALSQRVFFTHILQPLDEAETQEYVRHRLRVAGARETIFTLTALKAVYRLAQGNPRLINIVCDHALLAGYALNQETIGPKIVEECIPDILLPAENTRPAAPAAAPAAIVDPAPGIEPFPEPSKSDSTPVRPGWLGRAKSGWFGIRPAYWAFGATCAVLIAGILSIFGSSSSHAPTRQPPALEYRAAVDEGIPDGEHAQLKEAVSQLELAMSDREKKMLQFEQTIRDLEKGLAQEKSLRDKLDSELLSKEAAIADLLKNLEVLASTQAKMEAESENAQKENLQLRTQIQELRNRINVAPAVPTPSSTPGDKQAGAPDPADIIDFVIKRKSP